MGLIESKSRLGNLAALAVLLAALPQVRAQTLGPAAPTSAEWAAAFRTNLQEGILKFWIDHAIDHSYGGMLGWLDRQGNPISPGTKSLVQQTRVVWTFSAAYHRYPEPAYKEVAAGTLKFLREKMWDSRNKGFYWLVERDGRVADTKKHLYGQSFAIYALAEYAQAFRDDAARGEALELFQLIDQKAHDNTHGGYFEAFSEDWKQQITNQLAKGLLARKSMNTHIHLLESLTTLYQVTGDPRVKARLEELFRICLDTIIDARQGYLRLYFTDDWKPAEDSAISSYGHDIELSWLITESAEALGRAEDPKVKAAALALVDHTLRDGFDREHGGVYYEGPVSGPATERQMSWWVQAEALVGLLNAYRLTGRQQYRQEFDLQARYVLDHFVDRQYGEWFANIDPDGKISREKTSEWKGPYHQGRACLEVIRRLEQKP